jgi:hypothetical protein
MFQKRVRVVEQVVAVIWRMLPWTVLMSLPTFRFTGCRIENTGPDTYRLNQHSEIGSKMFADAELHVS